MSAAGFTTALEEIIQAVAAQAVAQALIVGHEQPVGRSPWYTGDEAAEYCRMTRTAVTQARRRGQLRFDRSETGRIRFHVSDLEAFLRAKSAAA
jgi:hypothetical protein